MSELGLATSDHRYLQCKVCSKVFFTKIGFKVHSTKEHGTLTTEGKETKECQQSRVHIKNENEWTGKNELNMKPSNPNQAEEAITKQSKLDLLYNTSDTQIKTFKRDLFGKPLNKTKSLRSRTEKMHKTHQCQE